MEEIKNNILELKKKLLNLRIKSASGDLKNVSEKELQQLDGIGEKLSKKIKQFADSY